MKTTRRATALASNGSRTPTARSLAALMARLPLLGLRTTLLLPLVLPIALSLLMLLVIPTIRRSTTRPFTKL